LIVVFNNATMSTPLPKPVANLFDSLAIKDASLFASGFTSTAIVTDEGQPKQGRAAIQDFAQTGFIDRKASVEIKSVSPMTPAAAAADETTKLYVEVLLDGNYVEGYGITEPFTLWFDFDLVAEGNEWAVTALTIGPKDPRVGKA